MLESYGKTLNKWLGELIYLLLIKRYFRSCVYSVLNASIQAPPMVRTFLLADISICHCCVVKFSSLKFFFFSLGVCVRIVQILSFLALIFVFHF